MPSHRLPIAPRIPALIFLNGPAGSGKSLLAEHLVSLDRGFTIYHHASPLWAMLDAIVGDDPETREPFDFNRPSVKASFVRWTGRLAQNESGTRIPTYREALIQLGQWVRDTFGPGTLSRLAGDAAADYLENGMESIIFPAIRTPEDLSMLLPRAAAQDCLLIRLFRDGCTWDNDLGGYLDPSTLDIPHVDIENNSTPEDLFAAALLAIGAYDEQ